mmetsp:Transcript_9570/g.14410  ORF Transcript_9570/g.14410 Transcript_9570/m.14410 type:complete len:190 (+) Transcript_9570:123-692(+)
MYAVRELVESENEENLSKKRASNQRKKQSTPYHAVEGVSESTKLVSYRRQIILNALITNDSVSSDERNDNLAKLNYIVEHTNEIKKKMPKSFSVERQAYQTSPQRRCSQPSTGQFSPEWKNYDVMKSRWSYIKPQTRRLVHDDEMLIPSGSDSTTLVLPFPDGTQKQINGKYVDAERFYSVSSLQEKNI